MTHPPSRKFLILFINITLGPVEKACLGESRAGFAGETVPPGRGWTGSSVAHEQVLAKLSLGFAEHEKSWMRSERRVEVISLRPSNILTHTRDATSVGPRSAALDSLPAVLGLLASSQTKRIRTSPGPASSPSCSPDILAWFEQGCTRLDNLARFATAFLRIVYWKMIGDRADLA